MTPSQLKKVLGIIAVLIILAILLPKIKTEINISSFKSDPISYIEKLSDIHQKTYWAPTYTSSYHGIDGWPNLQGQWLFDDTRNEGLVKRIFIDLNDDCRSGRYLICSNRPGEPSKKVRAGFFVIMKPADSKYPVAFDSNILPRSRWDSGYDNWKYVFSLPQGALRFGQNFADYSLHTLEKGKNTVLLNSGDNAFDYHNAGVSL